MKKLLSLLIIIAVAAGSITVGCAAGSVRLKITGTHPNGSITLEPVTAENGVIAFSGSYSYGSGYSVTLKIVDDETGDIYALAEKTTKNKGVFSLSAGLRDEAQGRQMTAFLMGEKDTEAYKVCFVYDNLSADEQITVISVNNTDTVTIGTIEEKGTYFTVGGTYSKGAGYNINFALKGTQNGVSYAQKSAKSKNGGAFTFTFELPLEAYGKRLTITLQSDGSTDTASVVFTCSGGYSKNKLVIAKYVSDIEALIEKCGQRDISVEYEKSNLAIINRFDTFLDGFYTDGLNGEYEHNYKVILELAEKTISDLNGYLSGEKLEKVAPIYKSSDIETDGQSFIAEVDIKGERQRRTVFLNGYGHWADAISDYDSLASMGANVSHYEVGPNSILQKSGSSYTVNSAGVQAVKDVFKKAEDSNISLTFMTVMSYFPDFLYELYPDIANGGNKSDFPTSVPYNPTHPQVKAALETFLRALIPEIKDYKSFSNICLAGEPMFISRQYPDKYYLPEYREFLKNKYGTVSALNAAHKTSWTGFDKVTFPATDSNVNTASYIDYREFNDGILTEWFEYLKEVVKGIDPSIPVHVKCTSYISSGGSGARRRFCGTNYEKWSPVMDLNGCDAWSNYGTLSDKVQGKTMWYDFMTSMKNVPVVNSEDHFLLERDDGKIVYNDNEYLMGMADVWQGAIHGRASSVYWLWDKSARTKEGPWYYNCNLTRRADYVAGIAKTNHDLNRLADEVTAIQKKDARVAVMYSNYSQISRQYHSAAMFAAYSRLVNSGEKVFVANDTYPEKINENENLKLLIVPVCEYMPEKVWEEMRKFENRGGKIIFAEYNNSYFNENGTALDASLKTEVLANAQRVSFGGYDAGYIMTGCESVYGAIDAYVGTLEREVTVSESTGSTEWTAAKYGDGYAVNLFNTSEDIVSAGITLANTTEAVFFDLTENEALNGGQISLKPYETKLVMVIPTGGVHRFLSESGEVLSSLCTGKITAEVKTSARPNAPYIHAVAMYKDGGFAGVWTRAGNADAYGVINSSLDITVDKNADIDKLTIKSFLFDSFDNIKPYVPSAALGNHQ